MTTFWHRALRRGLPVLWLALLVSRLASPVWAGESAAGSDLREGERLAAQLRATFPVSDLRFSGKVSIRDSSGVVREFPFRFEATVTPTNWIARYQSEPSGTNGVADQIAVEHRLGGPNAYWASGSGAAGTWQPLRAELEARPFAGSDFWLQELGLDYAHWPGQRLLRTEMRRSRSCHVLESTRPEGQGGLCRRVVSWIDVESGGVYMAEAYDAQNKLLKEFTVNSMAKVNGQWQARQIEMRNVQTRSRTRLDFDVR
jgi:hypothetical protein